MTKKTTELDNVKKATAIMFAALVKLEDTAPGLNEGFVVNLDTAYTKIREDSDDLNALETISWTRSMITGFDIVSGQTKPFFD
ncbi:hypothetical protein ACVI1J_006438 [Bradyrhizobium diazoefficiens]|uniref:hypothetical protein n=1 Tax=Bradyrhizobium japonicum TaxID=375 RepID=UPI001B5B5AC6|nr:hypothetical protein [Bradyrhizobium japonicum]MBP1064597.1 hypothetical protein [Bradyrhizobium japonicum]MCP1790958.1 hypothetical protein [Bradyrhizobium japonicum]MCP1934630.1 hypothetical protein [Bradyrhizobium japonicum]MCP1947928.1 hypothetical protein [Bradyrhizobium japonicum]MCS4024980.1 hypothetical protein [Bradyrhizobium japonicum]